MQEFDGGENFSSDTRLRLNPEICFFHIEKCMGSSMRLLLKNYFLNIFDEENIHETESLENDLLIYDENKINNIKVLLGHISFNKEKITDIFSKKCISITVVRNPLTRIISHYYAFNKDEYGKLFYELSNKEILDFLIVKNIANTMIWRLSGTKENLEDSLDNLKYINYILILENIQDDLRLLNEKFNIKYNINFIMDEVKINEKMLDHDINKDYDVLRKYIHIIDDYQLYEYIKSLPIEQRFKEF